MSGIPRQPAEVAKSKGVYRPNRHGALDTKLSLEYLSKVPPPPSGLNEHGIVFWNDMLKQLLTVKGLIMIPDLPAFHIMATKHQTIIECNEILRTQSKWITDDKGNMKENPVCLTLEKAEKLYLQIAASFGMTPSARNTVRAAKEETKEDEIQLSL